MRRFFFACKNKRSATERAKDALHSSESGGGLCGYGWQAVRNAIRRFFLLAKISVVQWSWRKDAWKFILHSFSGGESLGDGGPTTQNTMPEKFRAHLNSLLGKLKHTLPLKTRKKLLFLKHISKTVPSTLGRLFPDENTDMHGRKTLSFTIHFGSNVQSAGCIDLTSQDTVFRKYLQ